MKKICEVQSFQMYHLHESCCNTLHPRCILLILNENLKKPERGKETKRPGKMAHTTGLG